MSCYVDHPAQAPVLGRCIVLPGRQYTPDNPLLFFATQCLVERGWDVRQVWWEAPQRGSGTDEAAWVADQLDRAVGGFSGRVLVVGKSLGTLAAPAAVSRGWDGAWLTPILTDQEVAAALTSGPGEQFVCNGSEDPFLDHAVYEQLPGTKLIVEGDHVLRVPGDPAATVAAHAQFVQAFDPWLAALRP